MRRKCMAMSIPLVWPLTDFTTNCRPVLSSERAPQDEEQSTCPTREKKKENLVMGPKGVPDTKTDRPTDRRSQNQLISTLPHTRRCRVTSSDISVRQVIDLLRNACYKRSVRESHKAMVTENLKLVFWIVRAQIISLRKRIDYCEPVV
jgi:hypothetical protein